MAVDKMSISFEPGLGEAVRSSAVEADQSVSSWLATAARDRLRLEALGEAVAAWEHEFGDLSEAEVRAAGRLLEGSKSKRRRGAR